MNTKTLVLLSVLVTTPIALFATSAEDHKIEVAAQASYNYRTVLEDHVKVKVSDGVVTLTGTVQDRDEKDLAADTVENLPGVVRVENQIKVAPTHAEHSDAWIGWKLRGQLLVKTNVSAASTTVAVADGRVTLSGTANNAAQKELTGMYAKEIDGVKSVTNDLVVKDQPVKDETVGENIDDASITAQMKYALLRHKATSSIKTKVVTTNGKISITGEASSAAQKSLVTKLAEDVRGVKSVSNDMTIKG